MTIHFWATVSRCFICSLERCLNLTRIKIKSSAPDLSLKYPSTYFPLLMFRTGSRDSGNAAVGRQPAGELHTLSLLSQQLTNIFRAAYLVIVKTIFEYCSKRLWPPPPHPFVHLVDFFDGLGGTLHCSKIGLYKAIDLRKLCQLWHPSVTQVTREWYPSDTQVLPKWHPNDTYVVLNLNPSGTQGRDG